ncbi:hypothetical protein Agabi119p4_6814 [Agaricus bisporus var. burnettii]|uniref:Retrotransposon gag domain-containing protein n=2 Tax=Agaricus bisporus var. burnettii TaxID=192524 RepID=A0A8H7KEQ6_AGABI|nr:hypothetical protein Agabi119p4_6814 [Agaricus bisporus var. burnettii]
MSTTDSEFYTLFPLGPDDARVTQYPGNVLPVLSHGDITVGVTQHLQRAFSRWGKSKGLSGVDLTVRILEQFDNPDVEAWVRGSREELEALPIDQFFTLFRAQFLPAHWERAYARAARQCHAPHQPFAKWVSNIKAANACLVGTPFHKDDATLLAHFREAMDESFQNHYATFVARENLDALTNLTDWLRRVKIIASTYEKMISSQNASWFNGMIQAGSTSAVTHNPLPLISRISAAVPTVPSHQHYNSTSSTSTPRPYSSSSLSATSTPRNYPPLMALYDQLPLHVPRPPALTRSSKDYLLKHKGCFRCRDIYVNHRATECDMVRNIRSSNWERTLSEAELESRRRSWENRRKVVSAPVYERELV